MYRQTKVYPKFIKIANVIWNFDKVGWTSWVSQYRWTEYWKQESGNKAINILKA